MLKLKLLTVYTGHYHDAAQDHPILKPNAEKVFRTIDSFPNQPDWSVHTRNLRVTAQKLKAYLRNRYSTKIANKMAALFDWSMQQIDYRTFYRQLLESVVDQKSAAHELFTNARHFVF